MNGVATDCLKGRERVGLTSENPSLKASYCHAHDSTNRVWRADAMYSALFNPSHSSICTREMNSSSLSEKTFSTEHAASGSNSRRVGREGEKSGPARSLRKRRRGNRI